MTPICSACNDTHFVDAPEDQSGPFGNGKWMCTRCPTPCQVCRKGGNGPFCETTPCPCACHANHHQYKARRSNDASPVAWCPTCVPVNGAHAVGCPKRSGVEATDLPEDWDGDCVRCSRIVSWEERPDTAEEAICHECAWLELVALRANVRSSDYAPDATTVARGLGKLGAKVRRTGRDEEGTIESEFLYVRVRTSVGYTAYWQAKYVEATSPKRGDDHG